MMNCYLPFVVVLTYLVRSYSFVPSTILPSSIRLPLCNNEKKIGNNYQHAKLFAKASHITTPVYNGPVYTPSSDNRTKNDDEDGHVVDDDDALDMISIIELTELGLDVAIGPSMIIPGQYGLYCRCSDTTIDSVTLPECTLLCGYGKPGIFVPKDIGDKTVGFTIISSTTAVFYERQLMSIQDAITKAATEYGSCGLAGHTLSMISTTTTTQSAESNDDTTDLTIVPIDDESFHRYYCPNENQNNTTNDDSAVITIQNYGQYCNDLAWDQMQPPVSYEEYIERSQSNNCIQLVWRLEYDNNQQCLIPTWPVSVLSHDITFHNHQFMELGTRYGWNYWQAIVQLEDL